MNRPWLMSLEMEQQKIIEPTKQEKDHIFQLVARIGKRSHGVSIENVAALHAWAGVTNGFDARFLAHYFECKLNIPPYTDPELIAKLEGWLAWYRKRTGKKNIKPENVIEIRQPEVVQKKKNKQSNWDQECAACGGFGTIETDSGIDKTCCFCDGTGWMSHATHETFLMKSQAEQEKNLAIQERNQVIPMPKDDSWKKTKFICPACDGDGGAAGHCYKCSGAGWLIADT